MKIALKYSRKGSAKYISHLDMQRTFSRAVRRANIPAIYSQGFNPHIVMSFASPLSVGYATNADYIEIAIEDGVVPEAVKIALNSVFAEDIRIEGAYILPESAKKLMALNHSAAYDILFVFENSGICDKINLAVKKLAAADSYVIPDRKGREVDIAPFLLDIEFDEKTKTVSALLKNASDGALNPAVLVSAIQKEVGTELEKELKHEICRTECFGKIEQGAVPFSEIAPWLGQSTKE